MSKNEGTYGTPHDPLPKDGNWESEDGRLRGAIDGGVLVLNKASRELLRKENVELLKQQAGKNNED